MSADEKLVGYG